MLRFYLAWDDRTSLYGELRPFVMHYYLSDDTMEVLEVRSWEHTLRTCCVCEWTRCVFAVLNVIV